MFDFSQLDLFFKMFDISYLDILLFLFGIALIQMRCICIPAKMNVKTFLHLFAVLIASACALYMYFYFYYRIAGDGCINYILDDNVRATECKSFKIIKR